MHDNLQYKPRKELLQFCRQFGINTHGLQDRQLVTLLRIKLHQDIEEPRVYGSPGNSPRPLKLEADTLASMADVEDDSVVLEEESADISRTQDAVPSSTDRLEEGSPFQDSAPVEERVVEDTGDVDTEEVTAAGETVFVSETSPSVEGKEGELATTSEQASGTEAEKDQDESAVGDSNSPEDSSVQEPVATFPSEEVEHVRSVAEGEADVQDPPDLADSNAESEAAIQDPADLGDSRPEAVHDVPEASSDETKKDETTPSTDVDERVQDEATASEHAGGTEVEREQDEADVGESNSLEDSSVQEPVATFPSEEVEGVSIVAEGEADIQDPPDVADSIVEAVPEEPEPSSDEAKEETKRAIDVDELVQDEGTPSEQASTAEAEREQVQDEAVVGEGNSPVDRSVQEPVASSPSEEVEGVSSGADGEAAVQDPADLAASSPEAVPEESEASFGETTGETTRATDVDVSDESPELPITGLDEASETLERQDAVEDVAASEASTAGIEPASQDPAVGSDSSPEIVPEETEASSDETKEERTREFDLSVRTVEETPVPESGLGLNEHSGNLEQQNEGQDVEDPEASVSEGAPALEEAAALSETSPETAAEESQTPSDTKEETSGDADSSVRSVEESPASESSLDGASEKLEQQHDEVQDAPTSEAGAAEGEPAVQDRAIVSDSIPETVLEEPETFSEDTKEETTEVLELSAETLEETPVPESRLDEASDNIERQHELQDAPAPEASGEDAEPALKDPAVLSDGSLEIAAEEPQTSSDRIREETSKEIESNVQTVEDSQIPESRLDETSEELEQEYEVQDAFASEVSAADGEPALEDRPLLSSSGPETVQEEPLRLSEETKEETSGETDASSMTLKEPPVAETRLDGTSDKVEQENEIQDASSSEASVANGGPARQDHGVLSDSSPATVAEEPETLPVEIREETSEELDVRVGTVEASLNTKSSLDETPEVSELGNEVQDVSASGAHAAVGESRDLALLAGGNSPEPPQIQTVPEELVLEAPCGETKEDSWTIVEKDGSVEDTPTPISRSDGAAEKVELEREAEVASASDFGVANGETEDGEKYGGVTSVSSEGAHDSAPRDDNHVTSIGEGKAEFAVLPSTEAFQTDGQSSSVAEESPVVSRDISIVTGRSAEPDLQPVVGAEGSLKLEDQNTGTAAGLQTKSSAPGLQSKVLGDEAVRVAQVPDSEAVKTVLGDNSASVLEADLEQSVALAPVGTVISSVVQLTKGAVDEGEELNKLDERDSGAGNKFEDYEVTLLESTPALGSQTSRDFLPTGVLGRGTPVNAEDPSPPSASDIEVPVPTQSLESRPQEQIKTLSQPSATSPADFFRNLFLFFMQLCSSSRAQLNG